MKTIIQTIIGITTIVVVFSYGFGQTTVGDSCATPPANMVAWWPLDEISGTTANDIAGFNNVGTHVGNPTPVPGKVAGALSFNHVGDYVEVPDHPELNFGTGDFSIDAWIKRDELREMMYIVSKVGGNRGYTFSLLYNGTDFALWLEMSDGSNSESIFSDPFTMPQGRWRHVAVVVQKDAASAVVRFYFQGTLLSINPLQVTGNMDNTSSLYIAQANPPSGNGFVGAIDELELFKRALDASEILQIFLADSLGKCKPDTLGTIGGTKFNDLNGNGVQDSTETGLYGWEINLAGDTTLTTTTDSSGNYSFTPLPAGTYTISEDQQTGWLQTTPPPGTYTITLGPGQEITNLDFGNQAHSDSCATPPDSLVGWWPLDETSGTVVHDIVGGNNGTALPGPIGINSNPIPSSVWPPPTFSPGKVATSLFFYLTGHILVPDSPVLEPGTGDFTVDAWVNYAAGGTQINMTIVQKMLTSGIGYRLIIKDSTLMGGELSFEAGSSSGLFDLKYFPITPNQWHHVAATLLKGLSNDTVTLYLDGVPVVSQLIPSAAIIATGADLFIGGDSVLAGEIAVDEVEIFNRALTAGEVSSIWAADSLGKCKPDTLGTIDGTKFHDLNNNGVKDSVEQGLYGWQINLTGNNTTLTTTTDASGNYSFTNLPAGTYTISEDLQPGWQQTAPPLPRTYTITLGPGQQVTNLDFGNNCAGAVSCATPPDSLVAWWSLDETSGTIADDIAGFNNVGTYFGNPTPVPGKVAGALSFDSVDDYVEVGDHPELNFGTGDFSMDAWILTNDTTGVATIVDKRTEITPGQLVYIGYSLYLWRGQVGFELATPGKPFTNYNSAAFVADGQWHHIAVTVARNDTVGLRFYVDGVLVATKDPTPHNGDLTNTSVLRIASHSFGQHPDFMFNGVVDELELFNRVLTPGEVQTIWAADSLGKCKSPVTGIKRSAQIPREFKLDQNFPNPFNPSTTFRYQLPQAANVQLIIYNTLGQVVGKLVESQQAAGEYEVLWDARDDAGRTVVSGIYLYRIRAGAFVQTRKMLLLK